MSILFDVNFLIALVDPRHVHHARAHAWWAKERGCGWASCPLTQNGLVRVMSQAKYPNSVSAAEALELLSRMTASPEHEFWPDEISIADSSRFARERVLSPKHITDLYLLGLAVHRGGRLATFDRGIPLLAVVGAKPENLVVV